MGTRQIAEIIIHPAKGYAICGAKKRWNVTPGDTRCLKRAGWGTDHAGVGRCKLHGGATPIATGRYSTVARSRLGEIYAQFLADSRPMDLLDELALLRAALRFLVDKGDIEQNLPRVQSLAESVGALVKRIADIESENAVSRSDLFRIMAEMGRAATRIIERHIPEADRQETAKRELREEWYSIRLT